MLCSRETLRIKKVFLVAMVLQPSKSIPVTLVFSISKAHDFGTWSEGKYPLSEKLAAV